MLVLVVLGTHSRMKGQLIDCVFLRCFLGFVVVFSCVTLRQCSLVDHKVQYIVGVDELCVVILIPLLLWRALLCCAVCLYIYAA